MLVDKRVGWLRDLEVGSKVKVLSEGTEHLGQVTLITSLGVLLVRCADGSKFKIARWTWFKSRFGVKTVWEFGSGLD